MADFVQAYYGAQLLTPTPLISNLSRDYIRNEAGAIVSYRYNITIEGHIYNPDTPGISNTINSIEDLTAAFDCDFKTFSIVCEGTVILSFCPKILSISYDPRADNMVQHAPYSIQMETDAVFDLSETCEIANCLRSVNDSWEIVPYEQVSNYTLGNETVPYLFSVTHNVSAQAVDCPDCDFETSGDDTIPIITKGVIIAKNWVEDQLEEEYVSGVLFNIDSCFSNKSRRNYNRVVRSSETNGTYDLTETWILAASGSGFTYDAIDDFTIDISETRDSPITTVTVNGTIQGLEEVYYDPCYTVSGSKYENALTYYNSIKNSVIFDRAELVSGLSLNPVTSSKTYSHNPKNGVITYTYSYDDSPSFCLTGINVYNESFIVETNYPKDVYSKINVLGRTCPILQCLGIKTEASKNISINLVTDVASGCPTSPSYFDFPGSTEIENIIYGFYADLTGDYGAVYIENNTESWDPRTGNYSRAVTFVYTDCC